jgi:hypothetical protein
VPRGHDLFGVLVAQLVEAETAAAGDALRLGQQLRRVQARKLRHAAQVLLGVGQAPAAEFGDTAVVAQGVHHVVQGLARGAVHLHVAAGDQGQVEALLRVPAGR